MTYLVTGATGGFGHYALEELKKLVPLEEIYVLARNEEKAQKLIEAGLQVRIGDYADRETMVQALQGIDRLLFVSGVPGNRQAEHQHVVEAAKETGFLLLPILVLRMQIIRLVSWLQTINLQKKSSKNRVLNIPFYEITGT